MAYLITYEEFRRHFPHRSRVISGSVRIASVTLLFFLMVRAVLSPILV